MRNRTARLFLSSSLLLSSAAFVHAQDNSGLTGVVRDATGAIIPDAVVVLTNPAKGLSFTAQTNKEGYYRFPNVPPAQGYSATVTHSGFSTFKLDQITLAVGITQTQNAVLNAGETQTVEVSSKNALVTLNTTDASIGNNLDVEIINDLPIQNRNTISSLFTLQPGVTPTGSVTGSRTDQSSVTVDGMDANDLSTGQFGNANGGIPADATQEFRATVAGLPSNLGTGSGGQFQIVTKSGTNRFHGDINEYHRDVVTSSNTWANKNTLPLIARNKLIRNQFGGALGGPIFRDKLFFFADFNDSRTIQALTGTDTVPLDSYRAGNVSYVNNTTGCSPTTSRQNSTPQCISFLTPAQVQAADPAKIGESATIFNTIAGRYPHANDLSLGDGVNTGGFRFTQPTQNILYNGVARLDYNITSHQQVFVQFHNAHQDSIQSINRFAGDPITRPFQDRSYGYVGSHIWQIGNNKVNQVYYGVNTTVFSFPVAYNPLGSTILSSFSGLITTPYDGGNIQRRRLPIPEVRDDFNWVIGEHTIGLGGSFKFPKASNFLGSDFNSYTIGTGGNVSNLTAALRPTNIQATGTTNTTQFDRAYVLALGRVANIASIYNFNAAGVQQPSGTGANRRFRYYQTELYAGDTWKVNKNLTVSYGLRYSLYTVPYETLGAESIPSIGFNDYFTARVKANAAGLSGTSSVGASAVPLVTYNLGGKANGQPDYYHSNPHDFAPRFAFAYNPSSLPKTVFNASADLVYDRTVVNAINFLQNQSTFLFQNSIAQPFGMATDPAGSLATDPRVGPGTFATGTNGAVTLPTLPAPPATAAPTKPYTPYTTAAGVPTGLRTQNGTTIIDPNLKDPYNISMNAGIQQEFSGGFILRMNYAGRLGRRLLGQADASQLLDFPDTQSGQLLSQAFAALTLQSRAGVKPQNVTTQPWFEHVLTPNLYVNKVCQAAGGGQAAVLCTSNSQYVSSNSSSFINQGDITDTLQAYASAGALPTNAGIASQFARNTYYTNKGFSSYHGLLVTLSKNLTQGTKFDLNYTFSRSIDNASVVANTSASNTGFICDVTRPRACRGPSDFDATHIINGDFVAQLPFGRGRTFLSHPNLLVEELVGGWEVSGIPQYQSGIALTTSTNAFLAGFANNDPAIYDNSHSSDLNISKHKDASNRFVQFADVNKAISHFRGPVGIEYGSRNNLRGPSQFSLDAGLAKSFQILPDNRLRLRFRADFFNVLNHPIFGTTQAATTLNITSASFGVLASPTSQRVGQFSLRLEF